MKKFINILLAAAVTALAVVSCQKEEQVKPGTPDPEGCYGVYFPVQEATGSHTYDPDMDRSVTFTVARTNTNGAITVPYTVTSENKDVFQFGDIEFADGQDETELEVTFDDIEEGKTCSFSVQLNDDNAYVSHYNSGAIALDFSVIVVKWEYFLNPVTKEKALVEYTQNWWGETAWGYIKYYEVDGVRTCVTETVRHYYKGEETTNPGFWGYGEDYEWSFIWYTKEKHPTISGATLIRLPWQPTGYARDDLGMIYVGDEYSERAFWGTTASWVNDKTWLQAAQAGNFTASYYDGNGGFVFNPFAYTNEASSGWAADPDDTIGIAEGFTRVDYSLEVDSDFPSGGVTPIMFTVGADVAKVDYAIYEGTLNSVQAQARVDAIAAGEEENVVSVNEFTFDEDTESYYALVGVSPETTGEYTLVAVSFNKTTEEITESVAQDAQSLSFYHVAAADDEKLDVKVSVFTEDTPARYKNFHNYDSFAYGVSGEDLKEVHIAFYTEADVEKYGEEVIVNDAKADLGGKYVVSEDVLAEINADGGYYTIAEKMAPKTTFYVVVWATNGSKEGYAIANYTTEALPYVWNKLGEGQYTEDVACGLYGMDPITVACNVYEEANTPGLYAIDGFQYNVVCAAFGSQLTPDQVKQYEGILWENNLLIIDATNPDSVLIPYQSYGICFNTDEGFVDGLTSVYKDSPFSVGTLKDGVIAYETVKGLLCTLNGAGYYYANQHGAFKLVLPTAGGAAPTALTPNTVSRVPEKANKTLAAPLPKYEREVKSISVETKAVNYNREKKDKKQVGAFEASVVSFK